MANLPYIDPELVKVYRSEIAQKASPATSKRKISSLNRFFDWAQSEGHIDQNPLEPIFAPPPKKSLVSISNFLKLGMLLGLVALIFLIGKNVRLPIPFNLTPAGELGGPGIPASPLPSPQVRIPTPAPSVFQEVDPIFSKIYKDGVLTLEGLAPALKAIGGLLIEGKTVTISTPTGSNGDITINPDGAGIAHFIFEGNKGNFLNAQAPNLTSGSLYYGVVANSATGYNLIKLQSGSNPITRFSVDGLGNTFVGGNLNVSKDIQTSGITRLTSAGALTNITGYTQTSGNFSITQAAGDTATITKTASALSDLLTLTLDERGKSNSIYSTLKLRRYNGAAEAMALLVDTGNAQFNGSVGIGTSGVPNNPLEVRSTTSTQERVAYDTSNYVTLGVTSVGVSTLTATGTGASLNLQSDGTVDVNLAGGNAATGCTVQNSTGNLNCTGTITGASLGGTLPWSSLSNPTANLSLSMSTFTTTFNWATGTGTKDLFSFTTDASANGTGSLVNIQTGTSATVNPLRVRAGATEALFVNSSGSVGVNRTPIFRFDVLENTVPAVGPTVPIRAEGKATGDRVFLTIDNNNTAAGGYSSGIRLSNNTSPRWQIANDSPTNKTNDFYLFDEVAGAYRLLINTSGNVGIGTTSPGALLHLQTGSGTVERIDDTRAVASNPFAKIELMLSGLTSTPKFEWQHLTTDGTTGSERLRLNFVGPSTVADIISVSTGGNVGIGITNPGQKLDINGSLAITLSSFAWFNGPTDTTWRIGVTNSAGSLSGSSLVTNNRQQIVFSTGATDGLVLGPNGLNSAMEINGSGTVFFRNNVGIGTTAPNAPLQVGAGTNTHTLGAGDVFVTSDIELDGILYLDGGTIANVAGTATITFTSTPTTGENTLSASTWKVENTGNVGEAALIVNQTKAGDIFTASASGTPKFTIINNGNVGIGTTAPSNFVDVANNSATVGLRTVGISQYTADSVGFLLRFQKSRNATVGSHTIVQSGDALGQIQGMGSNGSSFDQATGIRFTVDGTPGATNDMPGRIEFLTTPDNSATAVERMRIDNAGNVGIGTTAPATSLHLITSDSSVGGVKFQNTSTAAVLAFGMLNLQRDLNTAQTGVGMTFRFNNSTPASVEYSYLGGYIETNTAGSEAGGLVFMTTNAGTTRQERVRILPGGNVGIGTTAPTQNLDVANTIRLRGVLNCQLQTTADGTVGCVSDIRLKDLHGFYEGGLAELSQIDPIRFNYKGEDYVHVGFSAQNIQTVLPEAAPLQPTGYLGLDSNAVLALAVNAVKELGQKVNGLTNQTGSFLNFIADNIKAGTITTKELTADGLTAFTGTIDNLLITTKLVSPIVETKLISPLADEKDIHVRIGQQQTTNNQQPDQSGFGKLIVENASGSAVASVDETGNATFSGEVASQSLSTSNASISGELYADKIHSTTLDDIQKILKQVETDQKLLTQAANWNVNTATASATINNQLTTNNLFVTDKAAISSLSVSSSFMVGTDLVIQSSMNHEPSTINSLSAPLALQSLALAPVEIMAGKFRIETNGDVKIAGNVAIAGNLEVKGLTKTKELSTEKFIVAAADATTNNQQPTINNSVIETNATAGKATIPAGVSEITIKNPNITNYTLVYITPTSSTQNKVLYVKNKGDGFFTAGFTEALETDAIFNWWVIDTSQ